MRGCAPARGRPHAERDQGVLTFTIRDVLEHLFGQVRKNRSEGTDDDIQNFGQRRLARAPLGVSRVLTVEPEGERTRQVTTPEAGAVPG